LAVGVVVAVGVAVAVLVGGALLTGLSSVTMVQAPAVIPMNTTRSSEFLIGV
jgi:hypothetical protein